MPTVNVHTSPDVGLLSLLLLFFIINDVLESRVSVDNCAVRIIIIYRGRVQDRCDVV